MPTPSRKANKTHMNSIVFSLDASGVQRLLTKAKIRKKAPSCPDLFWDRGRGIPFPAVTM
jgi:hypothetical protein